MHTVSNDALKTKVELNNRALLDVTGEGDFVAGMLNRKTIRTDVAIENNDILRVKRDGILDETGSRDDDFTTKNSLDAFTYVDREVVM